MTLAFQVILEYYSANRKTKVLLAGITFAFCTAMIGNVNVGTIDDLLVTLSSGLSWKIASDVTKSVCTIISPQVLLAACSLLCSMLSS